MVKHNDDTRWNRRNKKRRKKIHGMKVSGRSIKSTLLQTIRKRFMRGKR